MDFMPDNFLEWAGAISITYVGGKVILGRLSGLLEKKILSLVNPSYGKLNKKKENVVKIPLYGGVKDRSGGQSPLSSKSAITPEAVRKAVDSALEQKVKGIIFKIDSPGGSPFAAESISDYISEIEVPTVGIVEGVAASAAYWIGSACDYFIAEKQTSTIGSIGVIGMRPDASKFLKKYGIDTNVMTSGEYKGATAPMGEFTEKHREFLNERIMQLHDLFVNGVAKNRKMTEEEVRTFADGRAFLAKEALEYRLIDDIGGEELALNYLKAETGIDDLEITEWKATQKLSFGPFKPGGMYNAGRDFISGMIDQGRESMHQDL